MWFEASLILRSEEGSFASNNLRGLKNLTDKI